MEEAWKHPSLGSYHLFDLSLTVTYSHFPNKRRAAIDFYITITQNNVNLNLVPY